MDEDMYVGLCIIKVFCLIIIALSAHKIAYGSEYFVGEQLGQASLPHMAERSDFSGDGQYERPVFWNHGDMDAINDELQKARAQPAPEGFTPEQIQNLNVLEKFVGTGL